MRILVLGATPRDTMGASIAEALRMKHEVSFFPYDTHMNLLSSDALYRWNAALRLVMQGLKIPPTIRADRALLRLTRIAPIDLVLIVSINLVPHEVIAEVRRRTGALVIGWFPDAMVNFGKATFLQAPYEKVFLQEKTIVERLRTGLASDRYEYLAPAFDPELHRPVPESLAPREAAVDVATFGNSYVYRAVMMASLLDQGDISVRIHGTIGARADAKLRRRYHAPVFGSEKSAVMLAARIALNTSHYACVDGINKRTLELASIGAFQLTDAPSVARYLVPDKEVATFAGPQDLVEKVRWYLDRSDVRRALARGGLLRAWREHAYHHRLNELFSRVAALRGEAPLPVPVSPPEPKDPVSYSNGARGLVPH